MKKTSLALILAGTVTASFTLSANAAAPGFYVGAQAGYGNNNYDTSYVSGVTSASIDDTGLAGRAFAGYQFNPNWAAELGYTQFSAIKYNNINGGSNSGKLSQYAVDLVGKGILPLNYDFSLYGKLGGAYVEGNGSGYMDGSKPRRILPTYSAGVSYDITQNVPIDLSWTRIQKVDGVFPSSDLIALGVAYNFG